MCACARVVIVRLCVRVADVRVAAVNEAWKCLKVCEVRMKSLVCAYLSTQCHWRGCDAYDFVYFLYFLFELV